jgi:hypothetical protein
LTQLKLSIEAGILIDIPFSKNLKEKKRFMEGANVQG